MLSTGWVLSKVCNDTLSVPSHSADTIPPFNRCCLSCEFKCGYVDVSFSHNMRYFLLNCKGERRRPPISPLKACFITADCESVFTSQHSWEWKCSGNERREAVFGGKCNWISAPSQVESSYRTGHQQITSNCRWIPLISHRNKCLAWLQANSRFSTTGLLADRLCLLVFVLLFTRCIPCVPQRHCHFLLPCGFSTGTQ